MADFEIKDLRVSGEAVRSGGSEVVDQLEKTGYSEWQAEEPAAEEVS